MSINVRGAISITSIHNPLQHSCCSLNILLAGCPRLILKTYWNSSIPIKGGYHQGQNKI